MSERDRRSDPEQPTVVQRRSARPRSEPASAVTHDRSRATSQPPSHADTPEAVYDRTIALAVSVEEVVRARGFSAVAMFMVTLVGRAAAVPAG